MRKFILTVVLAGFSAILYAQSLEDVQKYFALQRWDDAKGLIDKFMSQEKNSRNALGWYYKGVIYSELARKNLSYLGKTKSEIIALLGQPDNSIKTTRNGGSTELLEYKNIWVYLNETGTVVEVTEINGGPTISRLDGEKAAIAFDAYKKYQELDPKNDQMKSNQNVELFSLYNAYFDDAVSKYNLKKYNEALESFKNAMAVEQYVQGKGYSYNNFSFSAMDTQLIQNTALAAYLAKDSTQAAVYYQKLADAKIGGEGFLEVYQYLVDYYAAKKDQANKNKYLALGKELYPGSDYWCDAELKEAGEDPKKRFAKYDEMISGSCNSYTIHYNYAAELFNYLYTGDQKPSDYAAMQTKLESVVTKLLTIKKDAPEANLLMARHMYNMVFDIQDSITAVKGTKPDDVKKKNALAAQMNKKYDELLPYASAVENLYSGKSGLKNREKGDLKVALNLILSYWENKKDTAKVKEYSDKMKAVDNQ